MWRCNSLFVQIISTLLSKINNFETKIIWMNSFFHQLFEYFLQKEVQRQATSLQTYSNSAVVWWYWKLNVLLSNFVVGLENVRFSFVIYRNFDVVFKLEKFNSVVFVNFVLVQKMKNLVFYYLGNFELVLEKKKFSCII